MSQENLVNDFIDVQEKYFDVEIEDLEYEDEENEKTSQEE
jgi:septum formation topological specificity factor MinE